MTIRYLLIIASICGLTAIAIGAMGSHLFSSDMTEKGLRLFRTANLYQLVHSLAFLGCAALVPHVSGSRTALIWLKLSAVLFGLGIILFSGVSYYVVIFSGVALQFLIPFGGLAFMAGWLTLTGVALSLKDNKKPASDHQKPAL